MFRIIIIINSSSYMIFRQDRIDLSFDSIILPSSTMNLSISTSQFELDPLLDTLTLEDSQIVIADESLESAFLGMATPMSEIPV